MRASRRAAIVPTVPGGLGLGYPIVLVATSPQAGLVARGDRHQYNRRSLTAPRAGCARIVAARLVGGGTTSG
ncbi:hypothetical protein A9R16_010650 [Acidiferrobacter thiooxydans]|uniref:hypothetical protein n=1 Tax=Acidiferrobacter thiooxydans TaxID=163359 RepID=UPI001147049B|nr:hypothetical protein [Acidiferrobacter thiooxydans]UEN98891.1 hypothetical protein A9R16_010650 [Acidiferrobacter thiooxydans]